MNAMAISSRSPITGQRMRHNQDVSATLLQTTAETPAASLCHLVWILFGAMREKAGVSQLRNRGTTEVQANKRRTDDLFCGISNGDFSKIR
jgi:hypothetical protein